MAKQPKFPPLFAAKPRFLTQFAACGHERGFGRFHLATGKRPQSSAVRAIRALQQQRPVACVQHHGERHVLRFQVRYSALIVM